MNVLDTIRLLLEQAREKYPQSALLVGLGNAACCALANELSADSEMEIVEILTLINHGITLHGCMVKYSPLLEDDDVVAVPRKIDWLPEPRFDEVRAVSQQER